MASTTDLSPELAQALLAHLTGARWFGGKGRRVTAVGLTPLPWLTPGAAYLDSPSGLAVRPEVLEVAYPEAEDPGAADTSSAQDEADDDRAPTDTEAPEASPSTSGPRELYQLVIAYRPAPQPALAHAELGRWTDPELGAVVAYDALQDPEACGVVLAALLDERRLRAVAADAEVTFHLSAAEGLSADLPASVFTGQQSNTSVMFGEVAMLKVFRRLELGHNLDIEVHDALSGSATADVARLFGWVGASWTGTDPRTGEVATLDTDLAMVVEKLAEATDGWGLALSELEAGTSFAGPAAELGHALRETHDALRQAFPAGTQPGSDVAAVMRDRLRVATQIAPALQPYGAGLGSVFDALAATRLDTQRVHGDFHLGQTLHTPRGWKIIDFEGEPAKTLAERSAPDSVWRDIAGMLRSFDYAAASVPGPGSQAWAQECRAAFLSGYAGGELSTEDEATLRAYEADKAVYEVVYEVRNRPEWVSIPLAAVAAIAGPGHGPGSDQARDASDHEARDASDHEARDASDHEARDASDHEARDASDHEARDASDHEARDATRRPGAVNQVKE